MPRHARGGPRPIAMRMQPAIVRTRESLGAAGSAYSFDMYGSAMLSLVLSWSGPTAPSAEAIPARPYGNVMGDGLGLATDPPEPVGAVAHAAE